MREMRRGNVIIQTTEDSTMAIKWYHNAKTGEIDSYEVSGNLTDFPRGVFLAYRDYLTAGMKSRREAEEWGNEHSECSKCKSDKHGKHGEACETCGTPLVHHDNVLGG